MRHFGLALVLACVLSGTVSAGEIPTTGATTPHPPSSVVIPREIPGTDGTPEELTTVLTIILTLITIV